MSYAYSPVAAFHLERDYEGRAVGYAAPTGGAPVLLKLTSDQTPIAFVRATAYSQAAADAGLRSGWCGFTLTGLSEAFAVGDDVELKCVASGQILKAFTLEDLALRPLPAQTPLSAIDLVALTRRAECCPTVEILTSFGLNHLRRHGHRHFIEASYQTLLGRWPDSAAPEMDLELETQEDQVLAYLNDLLASSECLARWGGLIPGPFHPAFRFDILGML